MMTIDPSTGLPTIPWEGHFWRIQVVQPLETKYYYIELRKHTKFLGLFDSSKLIKKQMILDLDQDEILQRAQQVLNTIHADEVNKGLEKVFLGDYPPKTLK